MSEQVNHPQHYGGKNHPYEAIKVIEAWCLGFCLGNAVKYISRAGKKDPSKTIEDLEKAKWYIEREILKQKRWESRDKPIVHEHDINPLTEKECLDLGAEVEKAKKRYAEAFCKAYHADGNKAYFTGPKE